MIDQDLYSTALTLNSSGKLEEITPADTDLSAFTKAIYVGTTGDVAVLMGSDQTTTVTFANVAAGTILPIVVSQIKAATTAADIVALY